MSKRLEDRVAIVTGAGHGIGKAYARELALNGAKVVIAELDERAALKVAEDLAADGHETLGLKVDVSSAADLDTMATQTIERFGRIDILVNNAAIFSTVPMSRAGFDTIEEDEWDAMMRVNVKGPWLASRAVIPHMRARNYGKIINISSGTALKGAPTRIHYVTSKAGILGFTKTLAKEVGDANICVNCVAPGNTLAEENPDDSVVAMREKAKGARALKRVQTPEDLTGAIVFFASSESDFITGQTLVVDGGSHMH
ncbi:(S)-1-Phenylethanol dehydrogenase [Roseivivax jejudonensis]|uniref:(S)-1-Phenylethanol dehydrogenase n=1 Tax=Roseivivax jejudonensis TaxID=1529041 RepID=A0A1X6YVI4_9RHOB|nr:3-oxoacyl-ACP reductase family protein [Roseivivax jejudonensis]SLN32741.1 (S)-1-Phenylethanol dehydrogenase [Roseivivax jejudonensis]